MKKGGGKGLLKYNRLCRGCWKLGRCSSPKWLQAVCLIARREEGVRQVRVYGGKERSREGEATTQTGRNRGWAVT